MRIKNIFCLSSLKAIVLCLFVLFLFSSFALAQKSYKFVYSTGPYTNLSGATSLNNNQLWDDPEYKIPIGFTFEFFDQSFDSLYVSDFVWLDAAKKYQIYAYDSDFIDKGSGSSLSPISYLLTGAPGSQILKIEWNNAGFYYDAGLNDFINVQLWLYEGSNDIEVRIGPNSVLNSNSYGGDEGGVVGLLDKITSENTYLTGSPGNPSQITVTSGYANLNGTPADGTVYLFEKCPTANFSYTVDSGLTVNLTGPIASDITSYFWDFGDGFADTGQSPSHTYLDSAAYSIQLVIFSNCDPDTLVQVAYIGVTGIDQYLLLKHQLEIYPNPANDLLHISLESHPWLEAAMSAGKMHIELIDLIGRTVYRSEIPVVDGSANLSIDIAHFERGAYIIRIETGRLTLYKKIVKY